MRLLFLVTRFSTTENEIIDNRKRDFRVPIISLFFYEDLTILFEQSHP